MNYRANNWEANSGPQQDFDTNMNFPQPDPLSLVDLENDYLFSGSEPSSKRNPLLSSYEMKLADPIGRLSVAPGRETSPLQRRNFEGPLQSCDSISSFENLTSLVHLPWSPDQDVSTDNNERGCSSERRKGAGIFSGKQNQNTEIDSEHEAQGRETHKVLKESDAERRRHPHSKSVARNLKERERRQKIIQKIHALHDLVPNKNKNKGGKVSMLNDVVEYMKALQNQAKCMDKNLQPLKACSFVPAVAQQLYLRSHDSTFQTVYRMQGMSLATPLTPSFAPAVWLFPCTHGASPLPVAVLPQHLPMNLSISEPGSGSQSARKD